MINSKDDLKKWLNYEKNKYNIKFYNPMIPHIREKYVLYKYNYILRHLEYYSNTKKKIRSIIWKIKLTIYQRKISIFIPINTCDMGLHFVHLGYRLINGNSKIGKDFIMHANTYVVAGGTNDDAPVIGDNVVMGVNSVILGNAIVGNNSAI